MGISFPTFVNPATGNSGRFLYELDYVLDVLGHDTGRTKSAYTYFDGEMSAATCESTAAGDAAGAADFDACAAVTALDDDTACLAVMKAAITASPGSAATCVVKTGGSAVDTEACACVTALDTDTACVAEVGEGGGAACDYSPAVSPVVDEPACTYTAAARVQKTRTAVGKTGLNHLDCMCRNCASTVEAIFQPVSRDLCKVISDVTLPCGTELAACEAAEGNIRESGSAAGFDSVYTVVGGPEYVGGAGAPSTNKCSPAASFMAYKNDWKLNEFAAEAADGTCTIAETPAACTAIAAADAAECGAADAQAACEAIESAATCESTAADDAAGAADFDACAAVTALDDDTACLAVMKAAITASPGSAATCVVKTGGSAVDTEACACVTALDTDTACVAEVGEGGGAACDYSPAVSPVVDEPACTYTAAARVQKTRTAVGKTGLNHLDCMCRNCASTVEAIFQPVSRDLCKVISDVTLPCGTELAACEAAEGNIRESGSAAGFDSVYTVVGGPEYVGGAGAPSTNKCSPAASFMAYKNDWKLNEFAAEAADGTCTIAETPAACTAIAAADAAECGAADAQAACEAIESAATCESTAADDAAGAADFDACAAVTGAALADSTACLAVKTAATETCAADGAENGAAVDPGACTYTAAASKCTWGGGVAATVLGAEVVAYQKCIAASRIGAFEADYNCLTNVGAATCGGTYQCTYVEEDKSSGAAATAAAVSIVALVVANL